MKIAIYSDLHNEFSEFEPPQLDVDLVVLAGDISVRGKGVTWANAKFDCPVIYVPGNHEYYKGGHLDRTLDKMKMAAEEHVHVLENEAWSLVIPDFWCPPLGQTSPQPAITKKPCTSVGSG